MHPTTRTTLITAGVTALLAAAALPAMGAAAKAPLKTVYVPAIAEPWVGTGIWLDAGESVEIRANGAVSTWLTFVPYVRYTLSGPDGQFETPCVNAAPKDPATDCARNGANYGALVAKIGGQTFTAGSAATITADQPGELQLAVNDNTTHYDDNGGGFAVQVRAAG